MSENDKYGGPIQKQKQKHLQNVKVQQYPKTEQLQQEISVKAYLFSDENKSTKRDEAIETRRFLLTAKDLSSYTYFRYTIADKFPALGMVPSNSYKIFWLDNEGDNIIISSDEELAHAMRFAGKDGLKIYIKLNHDTIPKPPVVNNATEQPKEKSGWQEGALAAHPSHPNVNASKKEQPVKYKVSMKDLVESISALSVDKRVSKEQRDASAVDNKLKDSKENLRMLLDAEKLIELKRKIQEKKPGFPFENHRRDHETPIYYHYPGLQANAGNFPPPQHHFHQQEFKRGNPRGRGKFQHRGGHHQAQRQNIPPPSAKEEHCQGQMQKKIQQRNIHGANEAGQCSHAPCQHQVQGQHSQEQVLPETQEQKLPKARKNKKKQKQPETNNPPKPKEKQL